MAATNVGSREVSILSVLPTAVNDTREGEGVTRELATGSITSSRVMELMSNQASETFQATRLLSEILPYTAVAQVVTTPVMRVQSVVPVSLVPDVVIVHLVQAELYSIN